MIETGSGQSAYLGQMGHISPDHEGPRLVIISNIVLHVIVLLEEIYLLMLKLIVQASVLYFS